MEPSRSSTPSAPSRSGAHGRRARAAGSRRAKDGLGWEIHDGLLCNDAMCIPLADEGALVRDGGIDLDALARALDRPLAVDTEEARRSWASARERSQALAAQQAPDFTLPDLDGRLHTLREHRGKKILLVAWASW